LFSFLISRSDILFYFRFFGKDIPLPDYGVSQKEFHFFNSTIFHLEYIIICVSLSTIAKGFYRHVMWNYKVEWCELVYYGISIYQVKCFVLQKQNVHTWRNDNRIVFYSAIIWKDFTILDKYHLCLLSILFCWYVWKELYKFDC